VAVGHDGPGCFVKRGQVRKRESGRLSVRFTVLGTLRAISGDEPAALPPKERIVLATLLLRAGQVVSVPALATAIWDSDPPSSARNTIQGQVKRLRQALGPESGRIVTRSPGYLIEVQAGELDLGDFTRLRDRAAEAAAAGAWDRAARLLRDALALWDGDPLSDVPSAYLRRTEVPRLAELRQEALLARIDADLRLGRHGAVTGELRGLVAEQPFRERLWEQFMLALYRDGRQGEALAAYRQARWTLRTELGIDPGPSLQELHNQILAGDPALTVTTAVAARPDPVPAGEAALEAPAQLPPDTADFTGRDDEVRLLCGLLGAQPDETRPGAVVISAVAGMGGIGKTALAVHVAHRLKAQFPGGQLYANLQGTSNPLSPADVLGRFLRELGVPDPAIPQNDAAREARYRTMLASRKMLILLDDARDAAQVRPLLAGSAGSAVIVTSRGTLSDLAGATLLDIGALSDRDAESLFDAIVGTRRAAGEQDARTTVLDFCAGLPLAIRIAGSRLSARPNWSIAYLSEKLADERGRLTELTVGDLAVRASFTVSYNALLGGGMDPARLFRLLGLADMTVLSLPAIAALSDLPSPGVSEVLETLTDIHLLQSPAPEYFRLHDLLRNYAAELAESHDTPGERHAAIGRLVRWYAEQAAIVVRVLAPSRMAPSGPGAPAIEAPGMTDPKRVLAWCENERSNLVAAARLAARMGIHDIATRIASETWGFFERTPYIEDWLVISQTGVSSARCLGDDAILTRTLNGLGQVYSLLRRFEDSRRCFDEALSIQERVGGRHRKAMILDSLAIDLYYQDRFKEALDCLHSSLVIHGSVGDKWSVGMCLNNIGEMLLQLNRHDEALDYAKRALAMLREAGDLYGGSAAEGTLADIYLGLGCFEDAVEHYRSALAAHVEIAREHQNQADMLCGLGDALAGLGRIDEAREAWRVALPVLDRLADPRAAKVRERF
jgi:DNA-binding SARP family transcriptional activator